MGNGTFNLTRFFAAMGIKNPEPSMREFVQPVVVVGQFDHLTPSYAPPYEVHGGNLTSVVGEFTIVQLVCRASGGLWIDRFNAGSKTLNYRRIDQPVAGVSTVNNPSGPWSREAPASIVLTGSDIVSPAPADFNPSNETSNKVLTPTTLGRLYVPPGFTFVMASQVVAETWANWNLAFWEITAAENPVA